MPGNMFASDALGAYLLSAADATGATGIAGDNAEKIILNGEILHSYRGPNESLYTLLIKHKKAIYSCFVNDLSVKQRHNSSITINCYDNSK